MHGPVLETFDLLYSFPVPYLEGNVDVNKLDTLLENMGISIKEEEFMDLIERLSDAGKHVITPVLFKRYLLFSSLLRYN